VLSHLVAVFLSHDCAADDIADDAVAEIIEADCSNETAKTIYILQFEAYRVIPCRLVAK
jgi:hypothetical protein